MQLSNQGLASRLICRKRQCDLPRVTLRWYLFSASKQLKSGNYLQVKKLKDSEDKEGLAARPKRPRALVLGPTRELTDQILGVAKLLSHHAKFRSACINGGENSSKLAQAV